jgi:hypothetical protein
MSTTNWPITDAEITLTGAYTCTHHNDQMRAACPVCLVTTLTAERDATNARAERAEAELSKYLSACPASPTEEERKRCQQWWAISGRSP